MRRVGDADAFFAHGDRLVEFAAFRETPGEVTAGYRCRKSVQTEAFAEQVALEHPNRLSQMRFGFFEFADAEAGGAQVQINGNLKGMSSSDRERSNARLLHRRASSALPVTRRW